jgi:hypothetical protein
MYGSSREARNPCALGALLIAFGPGNQKAEFMFSTLGECMTEQLRIEQRETNHRPAWYVDRVVFTVCCFFHRVINRVTRDRIRTTQVPNHERAI